MEDLQIKRFCDLQTLFLNVWIFWYTDGWFIEFIECAKVKIRAAWISILKSKFMVYERWKAEHKTNFHESLRLAEKILQLSWNKA